MATYKVLIVEDDLLVAENISAILEQQQYTVCGIAVEATEALALFKEHKPHLVLCDIYIKGKKNGIALIKELTAMASVPFLFITAFADQETVKQAVDTRPSAYLVKPFTEKQLMAAVNVAVLTFYKEGVKEQPPPPSARELEILKLVAQGKSSKQIADTLSISVLTVQTHRRNLMNRYQTLSSSELIALASKYKWIGE